MILSEEKNNILTITFNRIEKHNAFNEELLDELHKAIQQGLSSKTNKAMILKANGRFFSAGADLKSMQNAATLALNENIAQAQQLADVLSLWYHSEKPTLSIVQGPAFGGALGFIAASDMAIAVPEAKFCFSEAKLGLIPAVISPYILKSLGLKRTKRLFLSAETFDSHQALTWGLIDEIIPNQDLDHFTHHYLHHWLTHEPQTLACIKQWLYEIQDRPINSQLIKKTATKLAEVRLSPIAKARLDTFITAKK